MRDLKLRPFLVFQIVQDSCYEKSPALLTMLHILEKKVSFRTRKVEEKTPSPSPILCFPLLPTICRRPFASCPSLALSPRFSPRSQKSFPPPHPSSLRRGRSQEEEGRGERSDLFFSPRLRLRDILLPAVLSKGEGEKLGEGEVEEGH